MGGGGGEGIVDETGNPSALDFHFQDLTILSLKDLVDGDREKKFLHSFRALSLYLSRTEQYCFNCSIFSSLPVVLRRNSIMLFLFDSELVTKEAFRMASDGDCTTATVKNTLGVQY